MVGGGTSYDIHGNEKCLYGNLYLVDEKWYMDAQNKNLKKYVQFNPMVAENTNQNHRKKDLQIRCMGSLGCEVGDKDK